MGSSAEETQILIRTPSPTTRLPNQRARHNNTRWGKLRSLLDAPDDGVVQRQSESADGLIHQLISMIHGTLIHLITITHPNRERDQSVTNDGHRSIFLYLIINGNHHGQRVLQIHRQSKPTKANGPLSTVRNRRSTCSTPLVQDPAQYRNANNGRCGQPTFTASWTRKMTGVSG